MRRLRSPKLSENGWQELYKAAILELDPKQLQARVEAAEGAIAVCASHAARISRDERRAKSEEQWTTRYRLWRMLKRERAC
jgi:hypothetical protein